MNGFDDGVVLFLNQFARASWSFDHLIDFISKSNLFKGGAMTAMLWWLWFHRAEEDETRRAHIVATLIASVAAIAVARGLALKLPFRSRPVHDADLAFVLPYGANRGMMESWSAFPSDHAVLFFALAAGTWFVSRTAGILAAAYVTFLIMLPRLYLGLHYPSDILVGALIGIAIAGLANSTAVRRRIADPALRWLRASPSSFYACFFVLSFQIAVLFDDGRDLASLLKFLLETLL